MSEPRTAVIVGASLAGGRAAETLRSEGFDGRVLLVGEEPHRPYERPPLSKEILRGEWQPEKAFLRDETYYVENDIELLLGARATRIDPGARILELAEGISLSYHVLLLCTGGRPRRLPVPGMELDGVHTLRTIEDSLAIARSLRPGARIVVVGAGFIGSEVAAGAKQVGCDVVLLEAAPVPLGRALGEELGAVYAAIHRERGVDLHTDVSIERFEAGGGALRVVLADGGSFEADAIVVGVGIDPADEPARASGIACENGIVVDELCRTSAPGVFAAGDVANHPNPILGERIRVEHWQNAQNQGAAAARAMLGGTEPFAEVPWFWSDQYELNLQMFGHPSGRDRIVYRGDVEGRAFAAFFLGGGRVRAALGVNRAKDARAGRDLIKSGGAVSPDVLADEGTDLRALARAAAGGGASG